MGKGGPGRDLLLTSDGALDLSYIFPPDSEIIGVPRGGLPGLVLESERLLGPLCVSPRVGHDSGPGGG